MRPHPGFAPPRPPAFTPALVNVTVRGNEEVITKLKPEQLIVLADLADLKVGEQIRELHIFAPDGVKATAKPPRVVVTIAAPPPPPAPEIPPAPAPKVPAVQPEKGVPAPQTNNPADADKPKDEAEAKAEKKEDEKTKADTAETPAPKPAQPEPVPVSKE